MELSEIEADGCYGNTRDVISKQPPSRDTASVRRVPYDYRGKQGDEVVETGSGRSTKPYACADCRYATDRKNNLRRHRATMHERCERALECCGLSFVSKSELREHVTRNHGAGAGYACAECGRRFGRRALMRRHAVVHDGRSSTEEQRRQSKDLSSVGRRYACTECDYTTGHKSNLDRHLRRHSGLHSTVADSHSTFTDNDHYPSMNTYNTDDSQPTTLSVFNHSNLGVSRNGCCCQFCLSAAYYRHKLPSSLSTTSTSSPPPFMFNLLPPTVEDVAWSFRRSVQPDVDMRPLWSLHAPGHGQSTETGRDTSNVVGDLLTSEDRVGQLRTVDAAGERTTSSTSSAGDGDATASDVTGTCYQRRRRLRLLPLLHTCRSCSLTFVSQLQLKFHSDLFHRATDLDVAATRPICYRVSQSDLCRS